MEPIINQEQFLPIIQQESGGKRGRERERESEAPQLSVGDEGRKRNAGVRYMKNRHEDQNQDKGGGGKRDEGMARKLYENGWRRLSPTQI